MASRYRDSKTRVREAIRQRKVTLMRAPLLLCLAASLTHVADAYTFRTTAAGTPLRRTDAAGIQYLVNQSTIAGMMNADGAVQITADSDPMAALQSAAASWTNLPKSTVNFLPLQITSLVNDPTDGQPVIVFLDTPENRSVVGGALAFTVIYYYDNGNIFDADILFNPTLTFSTTLAPDTFRSAVGRHPRDGPRARSQSLRAVGHDHVSGRRAAGQLAGDIEPRTISPSSATPIPLASASSANGVIFRHGP